MSLFCFDFDNTLVNGQFHNTLNGLGVPWGNATTEQINTLLDIPAIGLKNPKELLNVFRSALANGHQIAITSYTNYPEVGPVALKKMGLTDEEIAKIKIVGFLPKNQSQGKGEHMQQAMEHFGLHDKSDVYLIDDNGKNCVEANNEGYGESTLVSSAVNPPPAYLEELQQMADRPAVPRELYEELGRVQELHGPAKPVYNQLRGRC